MDFHRFVDVVGMDQRKEFAVFDFGSRVFQDSLQSGRGKEDAAIGLVQHHDVRCFFGHQAIRLVRLVAVYIRIVLGVIDRHLLLT